MSTATVAATEREAQNRKWIEDHAREYLESGGVEGHIIDMTPVGGLKNTPTLLLKHIGRKTGTVRYAPLIYGFYGADAILMATKGGADYHPAWYLNMQGQDAFFQIATQAFRGTWRDAGSDEAEILWPLMISLFPLAEQFRRMTDREIPLVIMTAVERIPTFTE